MQLENQFNKVADQIEMAKTKRRYILNMALMHFFRRVKAGEEPGYPRFKGADRFNSILFRIDLRSCARSAIRRRTIDVAPMRRCTGDGAFQA